MASSYSSSSSSAHGDLCQRLIRVSCTKMVHARAEKGGSKLHKSLLVLHLMRQARDSHMASMKDSIMRVSYGGDRWRRSSRACSYDENCPPLELTVRDEEDEFDDSKFPLVFAVEARESDDDECFDEFSSTSLSSSPPLSSALDDALRRLAGSPTPDGRKRASTPTPCTNKAKKTRQPSIQLSGLRSLACRQ